MKSRAYRRAQRARLWAKRKTYYGGWVAEHDYGKMFIDTPKRCSCGGCSQNWERRHMGRVTRQEQLSELSMHEQILETQLGAQPDWDADYNYGSTEAELARLAGEGFNGWLSMLNALEGAY